MAAVVGIATGAVLGALLIVALLLRCLYPDRWQEMVLLLKAPRKHMPFVDDAPGDDGNEAAAYREGGVAVAVAGAPSTSSGLRHPAAAAVASAADNRTES